MEQIAGSEQLQAKIGEQIDSDALIALGTEHGCEFTVEDLQAASELSDEQLDNVAGGFIVGPIGSTRRKQGGFRLRTMSYLLF